MSPMAEIRAASVRHDTHDRVSMTDTLSKEETTC